MAKNFRASRFRHRDDVGEDVNPSAYIVNLADCMLVLAVGFAVALISHWNIPLANIEKVDETQMQEIDSETLPEDITSSGSYYEEAGTAYRDPSTGQLYIIEEGTNKDAASGEGSSSAEASSSAATSSSGTASSGASTSSGSTKSSASNQEIVNARANGAD